MGRVSDDHVGLGHLLHHAPLCHLPLVLLDLALDLRVALSLLVFLLDLLLAHAQLTLVVPPLVEVVQRGHHGKGQHDTQHHVLSALENVAAGHIKVCVEILGAFQKPITQTAEDNDHQQRDLEDPLERVHHALEGKEPLDALKGADAAEFRLEQLTADKEPCLGEGHGDGAQRRHRQQRKGCFHQHNAGLPSDLHPRVGGCADWTRAGADAKYDELPKPRRDAVRHGDEQTGGGQQRRYGNSVLTEENVTLLSLVPSLFGGCFFGFRSVRHASSPLLAAARRGVLHGQC